MAFYYYKFGDMEIEINTKDEKLNIFKIYEESHPNFNQIKLKHSKHVLTVSNNNIEIFDRSCIKKGLFHNILK